MLEKIPENFSHCAPCKDLIDCIKDFVDVVYFMPKIKSLTPEVNHNKLWSNTMANTQEQQWSDTVRKCAMEKRGFSKLNQVMMFLQVSGNCWRARVVVKITSLNYDTNN